MDKNRCAWVDDSEICRNYHDTEWGRPLHDDARLFELLCLEGFQAGLSWITVLKKRADFRRAFDNFDPRAVAQYDAAKVDALMQDARLIRHRGKITACINNAARVLEIQSEFGSFDAFIWGYVNNRPVLNHFQTIADVPAQTELSDRISKEMKRRGFKLVGATIIYSFIQAAGLVNDHTADCWLYKK